MSGGWTGGEERPGPAPRRRREEGRERTAKRPKEGGPPSSAELGPRRVPPCGNGKNRCRCGNRKGRNPRDDRSPRSRATTRRARRMHALSDERRVPPLLRWVHKHRGHLGRTRGSPPRRIGGWRSAWVPRSRDASRASLRASRHSDKSGLRRSSGRQHRPQLESPHGSKQVSLSFAEETGEPMLEREQRPQMPGAVAGGHRKWFEAHAKARGASRSSLWL